MNENIKKAIQQAEEIVKESKVSNEFSSSAYTVVLTYLLQKNGVVDKSFVSNRELPNEQPKPASHSLDWHSLVEQKKPASVYQLVALVVDYLEREKSNEQQDPSFVAIEEIETFLGEKCVDHIKDKDFCHLKQRILHTNSTYKYIQSKKQGFYVLSPLGRKIIGQLPKQPSDTKRNS